MKSISYILFLFYVNTLWSQYKIDNALSVKIDGIQLLNPSTGGMNAPQFSNIDINFDGREDIFVFERSANKILIFLNTGTGSEIEFTYDPNYEALFPELFDWAFLLDYNCDEVQDIFTYYSGSTSVYKGVIEDSKYTFVLVEDKISYVDAFAIPVYTSRSDLPAFVDVNFDGDIDVITFSVSGTTARYFENNSVENGWECDSLKYDLIEYCWGAINEGFTCSGADLGVFCKELDEDMINARIHVGSTVLLLDKDGDSDNDLVLGDVSCSNLVYYENGGNSELAEMISKDTLFPSNTIPAKFREFLSSFLINVNEDDSKDLVVSTNDDNFGLNKNQIWYYENLNTNDTFDFVLKQNDFLMNQTLDFGANAKPVFADYNLDGKIDIIVGIGNLLDEGTTKKYQLSLFENTGSILSPVFELITNDFGSLSVYNIPEMFPAFFDEDSDGDLDLFVGMNNGTIAFLKRNAVDFDAPVFNYVGIDVGINATPFFFDVNEDGLLDLIIGEQNGTLNYYQNTGSTSNPIFTLQSEIWGGVDVKQFGYLSGNSVPYLYKNEHDSIFLLVGAENGQVFLFDEVESSLEGEFHERDSSFFNYIPGRFATVSAADYNSDGILDFVCGNNRGGIQFFTFDPSVQISATEKIEWKVFPNPATSILNIRSLESAYSYQFEIFNLVGERILNGIIENQIINIEMLAQGMYIIKMMNQNLEITTGSFVKL